MLVSEPAALVSVASPVDSTVPPIDVFAPLVSFNGPALCSRPLTVAPPLDASTASASAFTVPPIDRSAPLAISSAPVACSVPSTLKRFPARNVPVDSALTCPAIARLPPLVTSRRSVLCSLPVTAASPPDLSWVVDSDVTVPSMVNAPFCAFACKADDDCTSCSVIDWPLPSVTFVAASAPVIDRLRPACACTSFTKPVLPPSAMSRPASIRAPPCPDSVPPTVTSRPAFSVVSAIAPVVPSSATSCAPCTDRFDALVNVPFDVTLPVRAVSARSPVDWTVPCAPTVTSRCASSASVAPPVNVPFTVMSRADATRVAPATCVLPLNARSPPPAAPCALTSIAPPARISPTLALFPACTLRSPFACSAPRVATSCPALRDKRPPLVTRSVDVMSPACAVSVRLPVALTGPATPMLRCAVTSSVGLSRWLFTCTSREARSVVPPVASTAPFNVASPPCAATASVLPVWTSPSATFAPPVIAMSLFACAFATFTFPPADTASLPPDWIAPADVTSPFALIA